MATSSNPPPGMERGTTLHRFITEEQRRFPEARGGLSELLQALAIAGKLIAREVNKAGLAQVMGLTGRVNVHGEEVQHMDEFANSTIIHATDHTGHLAGMASEEMDDVYTIPARHPSGDYLLVFDPVDGSSNIDVNVSIGTIFSIYRHKRPGRRRRPIEKDFLRRGTDQVCAGYIIYGSSTMLVYTTGAGHPRIHPGPDPGRVPALTPEHPHPLPRQDLQRQRGKRRQVVSRSPQLRQQPEGD